ncbi:MAG: hypothetical protein IPL40_00295 [Proteobacteria bacterium]|nr:hypothetical protein [Pseudomonadota bacterium]
MRRRSPPRSRPALAGGRRAVRGRWVVLLAPWLLPLAVLSSASAAPVDGGAGRPRDPDALAVRMVLEDTPRGREALTRVQTYFAAVPRRLGIALQLELGLDSEPSQRGALEGWREMVAAERARNPALPLVIAAEERNAGFIGPLLRVGLGALLASLDDAVLMEADKLQRSYAGSSPAAAPPGAAPAGSASLDSSFPAAGARLPPRDVPAIGLSYALALLGGGLLAALVWWCGGPRCTVAGASASVPSATAGAPRRRRRRR